VLSPSDLALGTTAARTGSASLVSRLEQGFARQLSTIPDGSRKLLLTAAAEPVGDASLLWRAVHRLGVGVESAPVVEVSGLVELADPVRFRHPLVRSAIYRSATPSQRREVHQALADCTDPDTDPDRRAWHRARAALDPDESIAADLERASQRALSFGGLAA